MLESIIGMNFVEHIGGRHYSVVDTYEELDIVAEVPYTVCVLQSANKSHSICVAYNVVQSEFSRVA